MDFFLFFGYNILERFV